MSTWIRTVTLLVMAVLASLSLAAQSTGKASDVLKTEAGDVTVERLVALDNPWGMAFLPDGRLLITEKPGHLRVYANGKLSEPVTGVPKVAEKGQGGLLDVAVDPDFATNGLVYLSYAEPAERQPPDAREPGDPRFKNFLDTTDVTLKGTAVARGKLSGSELSDVDVLWRQDPNTIGRGHFGGRLVFAPDGKLFITTGDRQRFDPAQEIAGNLGKVVRINPDGSIPQDNPFVGRKDAKPDIWTLGHRNAIAAAIHPESGQLWIAEMGPLGGDELNVIVMGRNYGWPEVSNGDNYDGSPIPDHSTKPEFEAPIKVWNPVISPSGLLFYDGDTFPKWRGNALMGGLSSMALIRLTLDGNRVTKEERIKMGKRIRDVAQGSDGAVLLLVDGDKGELLRLTPATEARPSTG